MAKDAFSEEDRGHMGRALALARRGRGWVEPNPVVGAVVVGRDGRVAGEGFHRFYGGPHAEVYALESAGKRARGGTLYVTLEPCCHWGKTPPCTDAVVAAGVGRVVVAMVDPFARVRGKGIGRLRRAGIRVEVGLMEAEARRVNGPFLTRVLRGRPWVIAKWAQSLDGAVATAGGESKWISGEESRAWVQALRGRMDGIVVGIGTALADDPLLTARPEAKRDLRRVATRIVLDSECRLPVESRLVQSVHAAPVMVVHGRGLSRAGERRRRELERRGVMMRAVGAAGAGLDVGELLRHLGEMEYSNVLVEGGPSVMGEFFARGVVDEAHVFIAPLLIPGARARRAVGGMDVGKLAEARRLEIAGVERSGSDVHVTAYARAGA
jgi:diaminohydroxyphosphoribosylaminopyrimidine deaminase/5-amino-6-(5-phosphoribosylamino)uracil reductase